jgi:ribosomal protein S7
MPHVEVRSRRVLVEQHFKFLCKFVPDRKISMAMKWMIFMQEEEMKNLWLKN